METAWHTLGIQEMLPILTFSLSILSLYFASQILENTFSWFSNLLYKVPNDLVQGSLPLLFNCSFILYENSFLFSNYILWINAHMNFIATSWIPLGDCELWGFVCLLAFCSVLSNNRFIWEPLALSAKNWVFTLELWPLCFLWSPPTPICLYLETEM